MQLQQLELTTVKKHMLFVQNFLRVLTEQLQLESISATDNAIEKLENTEKNIKDK